MPKPPPTAEPSTMEIVACGSGSAPAACRRTGGRPPPADRLRRRRAGRHVGHGVDIAAGAEMAAGAAQHQRPAATSSRKPREGVLELQHHGVGQRVAPVRPVQHQPCDVAVALQHDLGVVRHGQSLSNGRVSRQQDDSDQRCAALLPPPRPLPRTAAGLGADVTTPSLRARRSPSASTQPGAACRARRRCRSTGRATRQSASAAIAIGASRSPSTTCKRLSRKGPRRGAGPPLYRRPGPAPRRWADADRGHASHQIGPRRRHLVRAPARHAPRSRRSARTRACAHWSTAATAPSTTACSAPSMSPCSSSRAEIWPNVDRIFVNKFIKQRLCQRRPRPTVRGCASSWCGLATTATFPRPLASACWEELQRPTGSSATTLMMAAASHSIASGSPSHRGDGRRPPNVAGEPDRPKLPGGLTPRC